MFSSLQMCLAHNDGGISLHRDEDIEGRFMSERHLGDAAYGYIGGLFQKGNQRNSVLPELPPNGFGVVCLTCLSKNSRVSFSMCPSYKLVVRLMRPILERPKSVSLMWPIAVIRRLTTYQTVNAHILFKQRKQRRRLQRYDPVLLVGLEVTVHDAVVVQVLQREHGLCEVHARHLHGKGPDVLQQGGTVSTCRHKSTFDRSRCRTSGPRPPDPSSPIDHLRRPHNTHNTTHSLSLH